jgi:hypothetical protein
MKKKLLFLSGALTLFMLFSLQKANAQAWNLGGNTVSSDTSLGTINAYALKLNTNNLTRLTISKTGNVAIGTTSTTLAKFILNGSIGNTMAIFGNGLHGISLINDEPAIGFNNYFNGGWKVLNDGYSGIMTVSSTTGNMQFSTFPTGLKNTVVTPTSRMTILQNGNVGIGTASPSSLLHVAGDLTLDGNVYFTSGAKSIQFASPGLTPQAMMNMFPSGTQNPDRMVIAHSPSYQDWGLRYRDTTDQFDFIGSGTSRLSVNLSSGYVGIGTATPSSQLNVVGTETLAGNLKFTNSSQSIQFATPTANPAPMMYMFASGTTNTKRMVIAHSTSYPTWGLRYADTTDQFDFVAGGASRMAINLGTGNVGIGVESPVYKLEVCGTIRADEVLVQTGWCDYVFDKNYQLKSIDELEQYINENKHLPGIAPASEVEKEGLKVAEMNKAMMEKIEELTLYVIQLSKDNKKLQDEIDALKK